MATLKNLVDATAAQGVVTLSANTTYDDTDIIVIDRDMEIVGPRTAVVNSDFFITDGATVKFTGFTMKMTHTRPTAFNGFPGFPYPQNGQVTILGGEFWYDDPDWTCASGIHRQAIHCVDGFVNLRSVNLFSRINWSGSNERLMSLLYNSYCNVFRGNPDPNLTLNLSGTTTTSPYLIEVASSKFIMSGTHAWNLGSIPYGVGLSRDSYLQVGSGYYTSINSFGTAPVLVGDVSRKWVEQGSVG